jgi:hypothetical protein
MQGCPKIVAVGDNGHRNVPSQKQQHTKNIWHVYTFNNYCIKYVYKCKKITGLFQRNLSSISMSRVKPQDGGTPKIRGLGQDGKQVAPHSLHMSTLPSGKHEAKVIRPTLQDLKV